MSDKLRFGMGNAKLSKSIATFSLPAGHSCPFAKECLSKTDKFTGKIIDGQHCKFRCFAASEEALFTTVRKSRWHNFDLLRSNSTESEAAKLIQRSLPYGSNIIRTHVSGDYYNEKYFLAWLNVALNNPFKIFYGYTKATPFMVKFKEFTPSNFRFTASKGGTCDNLIGKYRLKSAEVVFSVKEAKDKNLEIDHDDGLAISDNKKSFALLLHGTQPENSPASKALSALKSQGLGGYNKKSQEKFHIEKPMKIYVTALSVKSEKTSSFLNNFKSKKSYNTISSN